VPSGQILVSHTANGKKRDIEDYVREQNPINRVTSESFDRDDGM
jgi:hypothetical protein